MALTTAQQEYARREIVGAVFGVQPATVTKTQVDAVSAAITTWLETPAVLSSFATAISATALNGSSDAIKASCLAVVAKARYGGVA